MSIVYLQHGEDREAFVRMAFQQFDIQRKAEGKKVLIKPNIVSHEPYPTTTHPEMVEACLELLQGVAREVIGRWPGAGCRGRGIDNRGACP